MVKNSMRIGFRELANRKARRARRAFGSAAQGQAPGRFIWQLVGVLDT